METKQARDLQPRIKYKPEKNRIAPLLSDGILHFQAFYDLLQLRLASTGMRSENFSCKQVW